MLYTIQIRYCRNAHALCISLCSLCTVACALHTCLFIDTIHWMYEKMHLRVAAKHHDRDAQRIPLWAYASHQGKHGLNQCQPYNTVICSDGKLLSAGPMYLQSLHERLKQVLHQLLPNLLTQILPKTPPAGTALWSAYFHPPSWRNQPNAKCSPKRHGPGTSEQ